MCDYKPGLLENSAKMVLLFHLIEESVRTGDKLLVFRLAIGRTKACCTFLTQGCIADFFFCFSTCLQSEPVHADGHRGLPGQEAGSPVTQRRQTQPELGPKPQLLQ